MLGAKPIDTPIDPCVKLSSHEGELLEDPSQYKRLVGKLIYLTLTHPDISFAVSVISQFMQSPSKPHFDAITRILQYLKKHSGQRLLFTVNGYLEIEEYSNEIGLVALTIGGQPLATVCSSEAIL